MKILRTFFNKCLLVSAGILLLSPEFAFSQIAPGKQWDKTFGGSNSDILHSIQQTSDGGYIIGGESESSISGDKSQVSRGNVDYWVMKLDGSGNKIWDKTYGGSLADHLKVVKQTPDGGYILGGRSNSGISGDKSQIAIGATGFDFWIVKLDASGNKLWDRTYGGFENEFLSSIQFTADGGYLLGGASESWQGADKSQITYGYYDYWLVKLDGNGNKLWDKSFGGNEWDNLTSIVATSDGGYILGGASQSGISGNKNQPSQGYIDYWIIKIDAAGNKLWEKGIGGLGSDYLQELKQTFDGGYILAGYSNSGISGHKSQTYIGQEDYWVVKVDGNGNKLWDKTFGGYSYDELTTLDYTSDGGCILGGKSTSGVSGDKTQPFLGYYDFWVIRLDINGNKIWDRSLGGSNLDELYSIRQTADGGYILGGGSGSGIGSDKTQPSQGDNDFWIIKLGPEILGVKETDINFKVALSPNPSQGKFNLQLNGLKTPVIQLTVTDLLGRIVLQKEITVANNQISEELEIKAAKGIYLLQIQAGNQTTSRKIVVE